MKRRRRGEGDKDKDKDREREDASECSHPETPKASKTSGAPCTHHCTLDRVKKSGENKSKLAALHPGDWKVPKIAKLRLPKEARALVSNAIFCAKLYSKVFHFRRAFTTNMQHYSRQSL